jgi:hypothetical protein
VRQSRDIGIRKFNNNANNGIQHLLSASLLDDSPRELARFLRGKIGWSRGLDKSRVAEYFGGSGTRNQSVLAVYARSFVEEGTSLSHGTGGGVLDSSSSSSNPPTPQSTAHFLGNNSTATGHQPAAFTGGDDSQPSKLACTLREFLRGMVLPKSAASPMAADEPNFAAGGSQRGRRAARPREQEPALLPTKNSMGEEMQWVDQWAAAHVTTQRVRVLLMAAADGCCC